MGKFFFIRFQNLMHKLLNDIHLDIMRVTLRWEKSMRRERYGERGVICLEMLVNRKGSLRRLNDVVVRMKRSGPRTDIRAFRLQPQHTAVNLLNRFSVHEDLAWIS